MKLPKLETLSGSGMKGLKRLVFIGMGVMAIFYLLNLLFPLPDKISYSTLITDDKGEVIHAFLSKDDKWRMQTELNEISPLLKKTILLKEDRYFYYHPGVNPLSIARAFFKNLWRGKRTSGASTLTMQVARALEPKNRNYLNKLKEVFRAFQLEWKYSKDEIVQLYLNLTPYGGNIEGVKAASLLYFKKNPDHLSLAEITALAIIPNRPSSLLPGPANLRIKIERNKWLKKFEAEGFFTHKEIVDALEEPIQVQRHTPPRLIPHLAIKLKRQFPGIFLIKTSINLEKQIRSEKLLKDYVNTLTLKGISNAALVIVDNRTQEVITYLGSASFHDSLASGQVNGAMAIREPGSTLKPLLYGLCIDAGFLTPQKLISDVPVNYQGYSPENYDKEFHGLVTMEKALEQSLNIPAVKCLHKLGLSGFIQSASECGLQHISRDRKKLGLSVILGGCGSSLEELTALFSMFANDGIYRKPRFSSLEKNNSHLKNRIISPAACFMINDILSKVNRPDFPVHWQATEHMPRIAWKTGTSYGRRDGWSIGYNKHFTVGVWTGNFSGVGSPELSGANIATPLLFRIFNMIDFDANESWFEQPEDCEMRQVCAESGNPPSPQCTQIVSDFFIPLVSDNSNCQHLKAILLSADGKMSYCKDCSPQAGFRKKWIKDWSSDMISFMEERKITYTPIPPHNPDCMNGFNKKGPSILEPKAGNEYLFNKKEPEPLLLSCKAEKDIVRVFWYINDRYFKSAGAREKIYVKPDAGPLKISCTDDKGRNTSIRITVSYVNY